MITVNPSFRTMRLTFKLALAQCGILLGYEGVKWSDREYAYYLFLTEYAHKLNAMRRIEALAVVMTALDFERQLIAQLPEGEELRRVAQAELDRIAERYQEEQTA